MSESADSLIHHLPCGPGDIPEAFTDPFRYVPCPAVRRAKAEVMRHIAGDGELEKAFSEGKMLGVLIVRKGVETAFLAAFSGNAGGRNRIPWFVPPVYDLLDPQGHFKKEETAISLTVKEQERLTRSKEHVEALRRVEETREAKSAAIAEWKARMAESKKRRDDIRKNIGGDSAGDVLAGLVRESQFEKAELKRISAQWDRRLDDALRDAEATELKIRELKERRRAMSDVLQKWVFDTFRVSNALGVSKSISEVFAEEGAAPPGGTGECAAPKLLQYAYGHGLKPLAMGEFWYGKSPAGEIRSHGRFYPSCEAKCGPLLRFMLQGLAENALWKGAAVQDNHVAELRILYEDETLAAVDKPSGTASVPGRRCGTSVQEMLGRRIGEVFPVHRLDMDTSGVLIFAKTLRAQRHLRAQFESRQTVKTYLAMLETPPAWPHHESEKGRISLPLCPDRLERPRQKTDHEHGKEAVTDYEIISVRDGAAEVVFHPLTGRTHQLRVHSASPEGLNAPIMGDRLYGSAESAPRLMLHAASVSFTHPESGERITVESEVPFARDAVCSRPE